jgi:hypothetical protein
MSPPSAIGPGLTPRFGSFGVAGGYESYGLRAVDPDRPRAVWLRHTIFRAPGEAPVGSSWITIFGAGAPTGRSLLTHKASDSDPTVDGGRLRVGDSVFGARGVEGAAGPAEWDLTWGGSQQPVRHPPLGLPARPPAPRTRGETLWPGLRVGGRVNVGATTVELEGWPGVVVHSWGAQRAERWIRLHVVALEDRPADWLNVAIGRVRLGPATAPWLANGTVSLGGERLRIGALARARVDEGPLHLDLSVQGRAACVHVTVHGQRDQTVVWRYADPDGSEHHVCSCAVAGLAAVVRRRGSAPVTLRTAHGAAYELGMREAPDGLTVQRFPDP